LNKVPDSLTSLVDLQELLLEANPRRNQALVLPQGITQLSKLTHVQFPQRQMQHQVLAVRQFVEARLAPYSPRMGVMGVAI
jgi:hypothetical protein